MRATVKALAQEAFDAIAKGLPGNARLVNVTVRETPITASQWSGNDRD